VISDIYAAVARRRRERYDRRADLRRRLRRPVVSIGNLAVGGRGKTPMAAAVARELLAMGERPAILTRGYARTHPADGVVVVRDPDGIRSDLARSGDEPLMLARQLPGAAVLVSADRYLAGRLAEQRFGATVHVLDDGFQHLQLDRDVDILMIAKDDLARPVTLPSGRLREPLDTIVAADAVIALDAEAHVTGLSSDIPFFRTRRRFEVHGIKGARVFAIAGIASPSRFFEDVKTLDCAVAGTRAFPDHYPYTAADVSAIAEAAAAVHADAVVTTEKDFVRLLPYRPFRLPVHAVALTMEPDPLPEFRHWLAGSIRAARDIVG
jgi:tetraacyldisaccharide 4'-kinase